MPLFSPLIIIAIIEVSEYIQISIQIQINKMTKLELLQQSLETLQQQYQFCDRMERVDIKNQITAIKNQINSFKTTEQKMTNSKELILIGEEAITSCYDSGKAESLLEYIAKTVDLNRVYDMNSKQDVKDCRTNAAKVSKARSLIEKHGADMMREIKGRLKEEVDRVGGTKKVFAERLKEIQVHVREPLTAWEDVRKKIDNDISLIRALSNIAGLSSQNIKENLDELENTFNNVDIPEDKVKEYYDAYNEVNDNLLNVFDATLQHEIDQKELEELRLMKAEKEKNEEIERRAAEKADKVLHHIQPAADIHVHAAPVEQIVDSSPAQQIFDPEKESQPTNEDRQREVHQLLVKDLARYTSVSESSAKNIVANVIRGNIPNLEIKY